MHHRLLFCVSLLSLSLSLLSGCVIPMVAEEIIGTRSARMRLLNESLARFHKGVRWGDFETALKEMEPHLAGVYREKLLGDLKGLKVIDLKVESADISQEDSNKATVEVVVRFYKVPNYVVRAERKRETWEFYRTKSAWLLREIESLGPVDGEDAGQL